VKDVLWGLLLAFAVLLVEDPDIGGLVRGAGRITPSFQIALWDVMLLLVFCHQVPSCLVVLFILHVGVWPTEHPTPDYTDLLGFTDQESPNQNRRLREHE